MKILFANDYEQRIGGTEVYMYALAKELQRQGHTIEFFFGSSDYEYSQKNSKSLYSYVSRIFNTSSLRRFRSKVRNFNPDIIHLHNIFNEISPSILLAVKRTPVIMTLHDYAIIQAVSQPKLRNNTNCINEFCIGCFNCVGLKGTIYERFKRFIHSFLLGRINTFIAPSKFMQLMVAKYSKFRPLHIYNGIYLPQALTFVSGNAILYSGRLTPDKGVATLLRAIPLIKSKISNLKLFIAGEGSQSSELLSLVKELKLDENVEFLGFLEKNQLLEIIKKVSLIVVPSVWPDNLPTVCIEALAFGKPVIGTLVGGIPEIITENVDGFLIDPANPSALAEAIENLLSDADKLRQMSEAGPTNSLRFDITVHVQKLVDMYHSYAPKIESAI